MITVGAAENVRAIGSTDGCGVTDTAADDAHDVETSRAGGRPTTGA